LASRSPARLRTLQAAGVEPRVVVSDVDESQVAVPDPAEYTCRLAELKCRAVAECADPKTLVIGCDSALALDGEILGKPADAAAVVHFADLCDAEIEAYVATGEPLHVAGAFTIDGLGGPFVESIEGDHHNVVGLSLPLLRRMLGSLGVDWPDLWDASGHHAK